MPLFSSRARFDEISKARERAFGYVAMRGQAAFALLAEKPRAAFLNPGFACGKQFSPEVIERLADVALLGPTAARPGANGSRACRNQCPTPKIVPGEQAVVELR